MTKLQVGDRLVIAVGQELEMDAQGQEEANPVIKGNMKDTCGHGTVLQFDYGSDHRC